MRTTTRIVSHRRFRLPLKGRTHLCSAAWLLLLPGALLINGKSSSSAPITQNGEIYVSLSSLQVAGAQVTRVGNQGHLQFLPYQGGTNQAEAVEGGMNTWLNNGIWRVRILKVEPTVDPFDAAKPGYAVTLEVRNATKRTLSLFQTGVEYPHLVDENQTALKVDEGAWQTRLQMKDMVQASGLTAIIPFYYPHDTPKLAVSAPVKIIIPINPANGLLRDTGLKYAVKAPTLRVWLKTDADKAGEKRTE